jgi:hypothetical protein
MRAGRWGVNGVFCLDGGAGSDLSLSPLFLLSARIPPVGGFYFTISYHLDVLCHTRRYMYMQFVVERTHIHPNTPTGRIEPSSKPIVIPSN